LLILTGRPVNPLEKDAMSDVLFDTQIQREVVFSPLILPREQWNNLLWRVQPIYQQIEREGVLI
jgi:hypothetical protein